MTTNFIRATKANSPTSQSGATSLPPISDNSMYKETSSDNHGDERVIVSWEGTEIIQITKLTFYYHRFSNLTNDSLKSIGRSRIQLLLENNTWKTQYTIAKNTQYSDNSNIWTLLNSKFSIENYSIKTNLRSDRHSTC